ncbi:MAG: hypothetical protein M0036_13085 [Desulfobacteraceae bacterium]|nr:hypothetical protein [Desulfobacteraceae bacterium]
MEFSLISDPGAYWVLGGVVEKFQVLVNPPLPLALFFTTVLKVPACFTKIAISIGLFPLPLDFLQPPGLGRLTF